MAVRAQQKIFPPVVGFAARRGLLRVMLTLSDLWRLNRGIGGRLGSSLVTKRTHASFQVLCYHRVNDENDLFFSGVPVAVFATQMAILSRYFTVLPLEELVARAQVNAIPPRALAITFDDGYRDNYLHAFPVLQRLNLPATIFLTTGPMDNGTALWHDRAFEMFRRTNREQLSFRGEFYALQSIVQKRRALDGILRYLRTCAPETREETLRQVWSDLVGNAEAKSHEMLYWQEVQEMKAGGITFGAHTVTHPILSHMPIQDAIQEIAASKQRIEEQVNSAVRLFAYPNGGENDFNDHVKTAVRELGFLGAVTTIGGVNDATSDPFALRRTGMWGYDPWVSVCRLGWQRLLA